MATVARMPASNSSKETNGKAPSCGAESEVYVDNNENVHIDDSPSDVNDWRGQHPAMPAGDGGSGSMGYASSGHNATFSAQSDAYRAQEHQGVNGAHKPGFPAPISTVLPALTSSEDSSRSLQEIFEADDIPTGPQQIVGVEVQNVSDDWCHGTASSNSSIEGKDERRIPSTPPSSLYAAKKPDTQYGYNGSYLPAKWSTTPTSVESSNATSTSTNSDAAAKNNPDTHDCSISATSSSNNTPQNLGNPILYSAIGSLESPNAISAESFGKRLNAPGKDFSRPGAQSMLIPPANNRQSVRRNGASRPTDQNKEALSTNIGATKSKAPIGKVEAPDRPKDKSNQRRASSAETKDGESKPSSLRTNTNQAAPGRRKSKRVSYNTKKPVEMFRPSCDAYTPRIEKKSIKYRAAEMRTPVQKMATPMGTLQRPNFRDALRRVAMIIHQHIVKIERRFENSIGDKDNGLFKQSMKDTFEESKYRTPTYKCTMVRIPMARPGMVYGLKKIKEKQEIPSEEEIYEFGHQLFKAVQLSSECSIVCLIYVERLMEAAKVPLLACTWRPIFMCGLLLASKVWQDLSSWNIEFASVYPQYSLDAINRLELNFLRMVKWDLYISSSLYAKYYFALRSLVEKVSFRQRYNRMVGGVGSVAQSEALKIQKRTEQVKEEALLQLSRSM